MELTYRVSCLICMLLHILHHAQAITYYIPEEQTPGTVVGNIGYDVNISARASEAELKEMEYFANESDTMHFFLINKTTSLLTINHTIDREQVCPFSNEFECPLVIEVFANSVNEFLENIEVAIFVQDINDNAPYFKKESVKLDILESDTPGKSFDLDIALDNDSLNFSVKAYKIEPAQNSFSLRQMNKHGNSSLQLVIESELDRESVDHYAIQVIAVDGGSEPLSGRQMLNISILDANDNKPNFTKLVYEVTVKETIAVNTKIIQVSANDIDLGPNAEVSYSLSELQPDDIKNMFAIDDATGEIKVMGQLEYMQGHVYEILVMATDHGQIPQSSQVTVNVTVEDSENNPPEISTYLLMLDNARVSEYESISAAIAYLDVKDLDEGRNGETFCELDNHFFGLQTWKPDSYKVVIVNTLDREEIEIHNVTVICKDRGIPSLSAAVSIDVTVLDENDNAPIFTSELYTSTIKENKPAGYSVVQVQATDADIGNNGKVSYYLNPEDKFGFSIDADTGWIATTESFDRELSPDYNISVYAIDAGSIQLSSTSMVKVYVEDVNDNIPIFKKDVILYVPENSIGGTALLEQLSAEDLDEGLNGNVTYSLDEEFEDIPFQVFPDGTVKTKYMLDREINAKYEFVVVATDNGIDARRSSSATATVVVTDMNDNPPVIIYPVPGLRVLNFVNFTAPTQTQVLIIVAFDKDEGKNAQLSYKIDKRNDSSIFAIDENGEIYVARKMTDTDVDWYSLEIIVSDQGEPPNSDITNVTIVVTENEVLTGSAAFGDIKKLIILILVAVVIVVMEL